MSNLSGGVIAQAVNDGAQTVAQVFTNNFKSNDEVKITIAADNAGGTAATNDFYLLAGAGSTSRATLPSGVTLSAGGSDFATYADLQDYMQKVGMVCTGIRVQDATTTNYGGRLVLTQNNPNSVNNDVQNVELSKYRESIGNGFSDVIDIKDVQFAVGPKTSLKATILKNTTMIFYLKYSHVGENTFSPVK